MLTWREISGLKNIIKELDRSNYVKCTLYSVHFKGNSKRSKKSKSESSFVFLWSKCFAMTSGSFHGSYVIVLFMDPYFSNFQYFSAERQILHFWHFHFHLSSRCRTCIRFRPFHNLLELNRIFGATFKKRFFINSHWTFSKKT